LPFCTSTRREENFVNEMVERSSLDLRYEGYRLRDDATEARLLASIRQRGIERPLAGVTAPGGRILLNGFKRQRAADKLAIDCVPFVSLGQDEATGILNLMRGSAEMALDIVEESRFLGELLSVHGMSVEDVTEQLSRSKAWVSMRRGLLEEMSPAIQEILFRGSFPVYAYLYTLRPFMRMNSVGRGPVERFMDALAGKGLSLRDIELLAHAYFDGPPSLREAIDGGKWGWSLEQMKNVPADPQACNPFERALLRDLERLHTSIQRVSAKCQSKRLTSRAFYVEANLLAGSLLCLFEPFSERMKEFYDRSGQT
jgi:hypothetical protein